jgi:hypothetical protein
MYSTQQQLLYVYTPRYAYTSAHTKNIIAPTNSRKIARIRVEARTNLIPNANVLATKVTD